ncbi:putative aminomethyltransferase [Wigglesworthia glossinidia endosymbiont of Glossina morsitans morsitans (Yale colony)]|uniref:Putative aminomethyltransferase n=1 Tax=Wigglesworthia glossinidia endosymbiont of Glossina morsitans morsitans (Yale colony) TaxID=1142511 RepID=H6Q5W3_WIGGL|nr:tRNA-modifying protein YgfZ [Wigglesworthia glossinidia]AFA41159.1 putative aminomethyltransferase [Wigglesworthia glossinidia endosymbiont of Glossina morsitans morsitans (Yale colony)]
MLHILNNLALVQVTGKDALKFLNNQFTCNILNLKYNMFKITSHCNVKGKVISVMYVFYYQNKIAYIQNRSVNQFQIQKLEQYSIFYDVKIIEQTSVILIELSNLKAQSVLKSIFQVIPDIFNTVVHHEYCTLIYLNYDKPRYLLIIDINKKSDLIYSLKKSFFATDYQKWLAWNIKSKFPIIERKTSELFFPQEINMISLKGVDFTKGCYLGQEIISRIHYLKIKNKFLAIMYGNFSKNPSIGDIIEYNVNKSWLRAGIILSAYRINIFYFLIQAVLVEKVHKSDRKRFRLQKNHNNYLFFKSFAEKNLSKSFR